MKELEERIVKEGISLDGDVLKVGSFLNQQVDVDLLKKMAKEVKSIFYNQLLENNITKVLTIESSGIVFACAVAMELSVPMLFAKKSRTLNLSGEMFTSKVFSYTRKEEYEIIVPKDYLSNQDKVLIVDDFLANGKALQGLIDLVEQSGGSVTGCVVQIEKEYQNGGNELRKKGYRVESLASIKEITAKRISFN